MTLRASVLEHGHLPIAKDGEPLRVSKGGWVEAVPRRLMERLRRFDELRARSGEDALFDWSYARSARAGSIVGVVSVLGLLVEILPKTHRLADAEEGSPSERDVLRSNLVHMLRYAGLLHSSALDVARLAAHRAPLNETLVRLFADGLLRELSRGLPKSYVTREGDRRTVRGRIVHAKHLRRNYARADRVFCRYDAFEVDHPLMRLFKATCTHLVRSALTPLTEERLRACIGMLEDVSEVPLASSWADRVSVDRRTERFAHAVSFCRLVARGLAPEPKAGEWSSPSLLFEMNGLFEHFVEGFLRKEVMPRLDPDVRLRAQGKGDARYLLESDAHRRRLKLKPDLLLERGPDVVAVIDTKWKVALEKGQQQIQREDLYQVYAYAREYGAGTTVLLYPEVPGIEPRDYRLTQRDAGDPVQQVWTRFVPVHVRLAERQGREELALALTKLARSALGTSTSDTAPAEGAA